MTPSFLRLPGILYGIGTDEDEPVEVKECRTCQSYHEDTPENGLCVINAYTTAVEAHETCKRWSQKDG